MNKTILAALAVLAAGSTVSITPSFATSTGTSFGKVQCADGTVFQLNDAITAEVACANHGGVGRNRVVTANEIKTNHGIPPIPDQTRPGKNRRSR